MATTTGERPLIARRCLAGLVAAVVAAAFPIAFVGENDRYNGATERTVEQIWRDDGRFSRRVASFAATSYAQDGLVASRTVDAKATTYDHYRNGLAKAAAPWSSATSFSGTYFASRALATLSLPKGVSVSHSYDAGDRSAPQRTSQPLLT